MNFITASLTELARNNRLFIGITTPSTSYLDYEMDATSYAFVKLVPGDIAEGVEATKWVTGNMWEVARRGVSSSLSVAVNSTGQAFACVKAMEHISTAEPTLVSGAEVVAADGYIWRFLYTVPVPVLEKFTWTGGIPLRPLPPPYMSCFKTDYLPTLPIATPRLTLSPARAGVTPYAIKDLSGVVKAVMLPPNQLFYKGRQFVMVEDSASTGSGAVLTTTIDVDGKVGLVVAQQGSGYVDGRITIIGDGTGAEFTPNIAGGKVVGFTVVSPGIGYSTATALLTAGTNSGAVEAIYPDFTNDLTRKTTLLSKSITVTDAAGATDLSAYLFLSEEPCSDSRIRGVLGSMSAGVQQSVRMSYLTSIGVDGTFNLQQNMQINTVVQTG